MSAVVAGESLETIGGWGFEGMRLLNDLAWPRQNPWVGLARLPVVATFDGWSCETHPQPISHG